MDLLCWNSLAHISRPHSQAVDLRGSGGRIALRPEAWKPATGTAFRRSIEEAGCLNAEAFASVVGARVVNCLLGAEAKACLSMDWRAIDAMAAHAGNVMLCESSRRYVVDVLTQSVPGLPKPPRCMGPTNTLRGNQIIRSSFAALLKPQARLGASRKKPQASIFNITACLLRI